MEALGLPAPTSLFSSAATAAATISAIAKAVATYGTRVTISEIIGAGILSESVAAGLSEVAGAITGVLLSFYLGACVGSLLACTVDAIFFPDIRRVPLPVAQANVVLHRKHIYLSGDMVDVMLRNPEMLGVRPGDDYDSRMAYYGFGSDGSLDNAAYT